MLTYFFFTITLIFITFAPLLTVILAEPVLMAFIFPLPFTVMIFLFEEVNFTLSCEVSGVTAVFNVKVFPFFKVNFLAVTLVTLSVLVFTLPFCTWIFTDAVAPFFVVTVIVAVPTFFAVILPFRDTFATLVLEDSHFAMESPS